MMNVRPVTIAVIADTHVNRLDELPPELQAAMETVDFIFHLGDFASPEILHEMQQRKNFAGVWGNHDRLPVMREKLNRTEVLEIGGKRLGLVHGTFFPVGRQRRLKAWFKKHRIDILLFGHSHVVTRKMVDGVLLFNPGTVTCKFPASCGSFGILTLDDTVTSEIVILHSNISFLRRLLTALPAWIIREGTVFLESWPFPDISRWRQVFRAAGRKAAGHIESPS